jgi:hypothetical protein
MPPKIKAMLVMARERRLPLLDALESCGIEVLSVCDLWSPSNIHYFCGQKVAREKTYGAQPR